MQIWAHTHVRIWKHLHCHTGRVIGLEVNGRIKGLRCGVFTFLILVPCLNHRGSTNPPRPCHLFLSDTPFNPLWMVLAQFHSVDNVILQLLLFFNLFVLFFLQMHLCCSDGVCNLLFWPAGGGAGGVEGQVHTSNLAVLWCWWCSPGQCGDSELHQPWLAGQIPIYHLIEYSLLNEGLGSQSAPISSVRVWFLTACVRIRVKKMSFLQPNTVEDRIMSLLPTIC